MYSNFPVESSLQIHPPHSLGSKSALPCQPCRNAKRKCGRELPSCMACVQRGKSQFCFYQASGDHSPARDPYREAKERCEGELTISNHFVESEGPTNLIHRNIHPEWPLSLLEPGASELKEQSNIPETPPERPCSVSAQMSGQPLSPVAANECQAAGDSQSNGSSSTSSSPATTAYSKMELSVRTPFPRL